MLAKELSLGNSSTEKTTPDESISVLIFAAILKGEWRK
jgi:hypothetical protein